MPYIHIKDDGAGRHFEWNFITNSVFKGASGKEYKVGKHLNGGGNGQVFMARYRNQRHVHESRCVFKLLTRLDQVHLDRFHNETRIWTAVSHQNIMEFLDSGVIKTEFGEIPWIAAEYGVMNLREYIEGKPSERHRPALGGRTVGGKDFRRVARQIISASKTLHQKEIVHRDIKPANFVFKDDTALTIGMIDFGIAKYYGEDTSGRPLDSFTQTLEFVGPQNWASPELINYARNKKVKVDYRSDFYQIGKCLWYMATGTATGGSPSKKACPFKGKLREIVKKCCEDDPDDRYLTHEEFLKDIDGV